MNQMTHDLPAAQATAPRAASSPRGRRRLALVSSSWHREIVAQATTAIRKGLAHAPGPPGEPDRLEPEHFELDHFEVPGAFEIPLHAQRLARSGRYEAIIACGLIVNGGIYRHEFVTAAVIDGLMRVQLDTGVPVFSAVLTPRDFHEHEEHRQFFAEHFVKKGGEAVQACLQTLASLDRLPAAMAA